MALSIRKFCTFLEETHIEGGKAAPRCLNLVVVAAVIKNPWSGKGFVENLRPEIIDIAGPLSEEMTRRLLVQMPAEKIEACGKAAAVGVNGEIEHASAMIHTLRFGNPFREAIGGTNYLEFANTRNAPGALLSLPMMHKSENGKRSHFLTANFQIADAPHPDEIVIAIAAADGGRPHARIADRFQDIAEMEAEAANAAARN
ncbi:amino acid synthesis family protein (plasmid) [Shinella sp. H4-D48]|uniref:Amino acid synthesis family protein n=1 Tax=Shinella sedimenti TaxID=2919913 RepID=A0ABT0CQF5_9HYPH|nr:MULTISPECIES: amino acid synthesis family protein [Shinella]MCJ8150807.1 amino acid synthesis family protein [Shinella sedimenti]UNK40066.1 amino acid synthesis family protein [Shinella sp. H4-D48]